MKKRLNKTIFLVCILQIFLLVNFGVANNYFLGELFSDEIGIVSAIGEGCCFDKDEGLCSTNSERSDCESEGGEWSSDRNCVNAECQKGCCILGDEVAFVTDTRCQKLSDLKGFEKYFKANIDDEYACLLLQDLLPEGACIIGEGTCTRTTINNCVGEFYSGYLCSNPELNTSCERQDSIDCVSGLDEIYWFDSCGNKENIYSSDKNASWNEGKILDKSESCGVGSSNANSVSCGNCNYLLGSVCSETKFTETSVEDGDFICENLNCGDKENGESWCVYDAAVGDGKDPAGSRHWKQMCVDGEIVVEPCADYRGQVCVEIETDGIANADCIVNEATRCLGYESFECMQNPFCVLKIINVGDDFNFDACVPKYPKGFDMSGETSFMDAYEICKRADQTCVVLYEKNIVGQWECKQNCECEEKTFAEQMNDLCISLGDCGSYINYIGQGSDNIQVRNSEEVHWFEYLQYAEEFEGKIPYEEIIEWDGGGLFSGGASSSEEEESGGIVDRIGDAMGAVGTVVKGMSWAFGSELAAQQAFQQVAQTGVYMSADASIEAASIAANEAGQGAIAGNALVSAEIAAMGTVLSAASIGFTIASFLADMMGIQGAGAMAFKIGGAIAGAGVGMTYLTESVTLMAIGPYAMGVGAAIMVYVAAIGWGRTKQVKVEFSCFPWQAPLGNSDCEQCNEDPLKPCSEYRCSSLGQSCVLSDVDSENPICGSTSVSDNSPPGISVGQISEGFKFLITPEGARVRTENNDCIPGFTIVQFELVTNEKAQCKYSFDEFTAYDSMENYFLEGTYYGTSHTSEFMMPGLQNILQENISSALIRELYENFTIYVRCEDLHENSNGNAFELDFCVTEDDVLPPKIIASNLAKEGFIPNNKNSTYFQIWLNEPAECKYDTLDQEYDDLDVMMNCNKHIYENSEYGWACETTLEGLDELENSIYIRCKDQPLLNETDPLRNVNNESDLFVIKKSSEDLFIEEISPSGIIETGFQPISVNLKVKTSGGSSGGISNCLYRFDTNRSYNLFEVTSSSIHTQYLDMMTNGTYNVYVYCEDIAGNVAEGEESFKIKIDETPPVVIRTYKESSEFVIITDELAECRYSNVDCNFNFENGTSMTTSFSTEHTALAEVNQKYYIKCADRWDNKPSGGCTTIISPLE